MEKKTLPLEVKIFVLAFAKNKDLLSFHMEDEDLIDACREIRWVGKGKRVPIPEDLSMLKELRKIVLAFSEIERVPKLPPLLREIDVAYCPLREWPELPKRCKKIDARGTDFEEMTTVEAA